MGQSASLELSQKIIDECNQGKDGIIDLVKNGEFVCLVKEHWSSSASQALKELVKKLGDSSKRSSYSKKPIELQKAVQSLIEVCKKNPEQFFEQASISGNFTNANFACFLYDYLEATEKAAIKGEIQRRYALLFFHRLEQKIGGKYHSCLAQCIVRQHSELDYTEVRRNCRKWGSAGSRYACYVEKFGNSALFVLSTDISPNQYERDIPEKSVDHDNFLQNLNARKMCEAAKKCKDVGDALVARGDQVMEDWFTHLSGFQPRSAKKARVDRPTQTKQRPTKRPRVAKEADANGSEPSESSSSPDTLDEGSSDHRAQGQSPYERVQNNISAPLVNETNNETGGIDQIRDSNEQTGDTPAGTDQTHVTQRPRES